MADIEITTKPTKVGLTGDERFVVHDPASPDKVAVTSLAAVAQYMVDSGLLGSAQLADLTLNLSPVAIDAPEGTVVGTISGNNPRSTLAIAPAGNFTLSGNQIKKGPAPYSLSGAYPIVVTETLAGSPNSPHSTQASVTVTIDGTPTMGKRWSPEYFPELFLNIWVAEDLLDGPVALHKARGIHGHTATQTDSARQPVKTANGVEFAAQSPRGLTIPNIFDGEKISRWAMMSFRLNGAIGQPAPMYAVNDVFSSGGWLPQMQPLSATVFRVRWRGQAGDSATWGVNCNGLISDGNVWNVCLTHRRNGNIYASLNGADGVPDPSNPNVPFTCAEQATAGQIGTTAVNGSPWAYDVIIQGQQELSDAVIRKLEGWAAHRRGAQANLVADHPYRVNHPVIDAEDFPDVYKFDATAWAASTAFANSAGRFVNRGNAPPAETDMVTVFRDDFREDSVVRSFNVPVHHAIWFGPGYNTAVGVNAVLNFPPDIPDCYIHDPVAKTMTLRLQADAAQSNRWETGAIYTVDNAGTGRSWAGERVYELRMTLPDPPVIGGLWYAFWSYMIEHLFNRIGERIEVDFFELDGAGQQWINGLASHVHSGRIPGRLGHLASDAPAFKPFGYTMNTANVGREIDFWNNQPHTYQVRVMQDFTYLVIDNIELGRMQTPREYLRKSHVIVNSAYRSANGAGTPGQNYDMILHHVEVRQPRAKIDGFAAPFTARPTLSGTMQSGQVVTCDAKLPEKLAVTADYWWYRSAYPIVGQRGPTYTLTDADVGNKIRCMVRATGAMNQPEAWTAETVAVGGAVGSPSGSLLFNGSALVADGEKLVVENI